MKLNMGENIRRIRRAKDITQEQLAEMLGVSVQSVSRWENGVTYPDMETVPAIASVLDIPIEVLFGQTDEEKKKYCDEIFQHLKIAVHDGKENDIADVLKCIRRNLREYQDYWFYEIYNLIWRKRLDKNEAIMEELRLLTEEIRKVCSKKYNHDIAVEWMSIIEDDEHIDDFLNNSASDRDMSGMRLLLNRYRNRGEYEKHEPIRKYHLWRLIEELLETPMNWDSKSFEDKDPEYVTWVNKNNLLYLHSIRNIVPNKKYPLTGNGEVDLWCETLLGVGWKQIAAYSRDGKIEDAFLMLEDFVSFLEKIMAIKENEFKLSCSSPAFEGFYMNAKFYWDEGNDGLEYLKFCYESHDSECWIIPENYYFVIKNYCGELAADPRYEDYLKRLKNCIITRKKQE